MKIIEVARSAWEGQQDTDSEALWTFKPTHVFIKPNPGLTFAEFEKIHKITHEDQKNDALFYTGTTYTGTKKNLIKLIDYYVSRVERPAAKLALTKQNKHLLLKSAKKK